MPAKEWMERYVELEEALMFVEVVAEGAAYPQPITKRMAETDAILQASKCPDNQVDVTRTVWKLECEDERHMVAVYSRGTKIRLLDSKMVTGGLFEVTAD